MKYLSSIFAAIFLAISITVAQAAPLPTAEVATMVSEIDKVMDSGLCAVANDTSDRGTEKITLVLRQPDRSVLIREILVNDYNWMRSANYQKTPNGRWLMSVRAEQVCLIDGTSPRCFAYRSYFRRFFN